MDITIGADPELFIKNKKTGKFVCAYGLLPGTKYEPYKVNKGAVQVDGFAFEYNIEPVKNSKDFVKNNKEVMAQMKEMVEKIDKDFELVATPIADFDPKYFASVDPEAKILGCDPDFNITGTMNIRPQIENSPFRTAAGHIHIGWTKDEDITDPIHFEDCRFVAHYFVQKQSSFGGLTPEEQRRLYYYGGSGSFRPKSYGVELRAFSNLWTRTEESMERVYNFVDRRMDEIDQQSKTRG